MVQILFFSRFLITLLQAVALSRAQTDAKITCDDMCSVKSPPRFFQNCFCDSQCEIYNDCCADFRTTKTEKTRFNCDVKVGTHRYLYSLGSCSKSWPADSVYSRNVKNKCELQDKEPDLVDLVPVHSAQTPGLIYRNFYCAKCNLEKFNAHAVQFFAINSSTFIDTREQIIQDFETILLNEEKQSAATEIVFIKPENSFIERECIRHIDTCLPDLKNDLCENGPTAYRYTRFGLAYKNEHCAECNLEILSELSCFPMWMSTRGGLPRNQNLQVLFDLSDLAEEIEIKIRLRFSGVDLKNTPNETTSECDRGSDQTSAKNRPLICRVYRLRKKSCSSDQEFTASLYVKKYLTIVGQSLSISCILILIVIYALSKHLRNRPGKMLMCLSGALALSQLFFLLATYTAKPFNNCEMNEFESQIEMFTAIRSVFSCYIYGLCMHYFHLALFTWSFIIAYDMFSAFTALASSKERGNKRKKSTIDNSGVFIKYMIYGWCAPLLPISILICTQMVTNKMAYAFNGACFISDRTDLVLYFVAPVVCVLAANFYFLVCSVIAIRSVDRLSKQYLKNETTSAAATTSSNEAKNAKSQQNAAAVQSGGGDKKRFSLFLKLFVLTGMTWCAGVADALTSQRIAFLGFFYIVLNSVQGVFVFAAFGLFSRQTRRSVRGSKLFTTLMSSSSGYGSGRTRGASTSTSTTPAAINKSNTRAVSIDIVKV